MNRELYFLYDSAPDSVKVRLLQKYPQLNHRFEEGDWVYLSKTAALLRYTTENLYTVGWGLADIWTRRFELINFMKLQSPILVPAPLGEVQERFKREAMIRGVSTDKEVTCMRGYGTGTVGTLEEFSFNIYEDSNNFWVLCDDGLWRCVYQDGVWIDEQ